MVKRVSITDELVEREKRSATGQGQRFIRDKKLRGFALRLTSGEKTFIWEGRLKNGRVCRHVVGAATCTGQTGEWTVKAAREYVEREIIPAIHRGEDPNAAKREAAAKEREDSYTFGKLEAEYFSRYANMKKRESSVAFDHLYLDTYIPQSWRSHRLSDFSDREVHNLLAEIGKPRMVGKRSRGGPYVANHAFRLLRSMFNLAIKWKMATANPTVGFEAFKEIKRKRFLKPEELQRLSESLAAETDWRWKAYFPLMLYTGARRSEVLFARWNNVDLSARTIRFPMTKDGDEHTLPLVDSAIDILEALPSRTKGTDAPLFPDVSESKAEKAWNRIRERAGIKDVRIHDLRHTLASWMAGQGFSLPLIGKALNHASVATTQRYAHLDLDPVRAAMEKTSGLLDQHLTGAGR